MKYFNKFLNIHGVTRFMEHHSFKDFAGSLEENTKVQKISVMPNIHRGLQLQGQKNIFDDSRFGSESSLKQSSSHKSFRLALKIISHSLSIPECPRS